MLLGGSPSVSQHEADQSAFRYRLPCKPRARKLFACFRIFQFAFPVNLGNLSSRYMTGLWTRSRTFEPRTRNGMFMHWLADQQPLRGLRTSRLPLPANPQNKTFTEAQPIEPLGFTPAPERGSSDPHPLSLTNPRLQSTSVGGHAPTRICAKLLSAVSEPPAGSLVAPPSWLAKTPRLGAPAEPAELTVSFRCSGLPDLLYSGG